MKTDSTYHRFHLSLRIYSLSTGYPIFLYFVVGTVKCKSILIKRHLFRTVTDSKVVAYKTIANHLACEAVENREQRIAVP